MLGAIAGDIIGSAYEFHATKSKNFPLFVDESRFTDDSVLTVAVAEWILDGGDLASRLRHYYSIFPRAGYGGMFREWAESPSRGPYYSFGNGSAMRVNPVGFAFDVLDDVLRVAEESAAVTHDHPEGVRGAQAVAMAIFLARNERDKNEIARELKSRFAYDLDTPLDAIRPSYSFDVTCQGSVPQALRAFIESTSFEDALRNAVSLGGDADTQACIAGGVAEAYYGVPKEIEAEVRRRLDPRLAEVMDRFGGGARASCPQ